MDDPTERAVRTWMVTDSSKQIDELVAEIGGGRTSWLNFVKALGEYLTSEEEEPRRKGVQILSLVLESSPPAKLNRQSTHVLITFFCSKLDDSTTLVPALKGLLPLVSSSSCTDDDAVSVAQSLFQHVQMKSLIQSERLVAWSVMDRVLSRHRDALKALGSDFVGSYAAFAEGEKDPRNLIIAFALARVIIIEFDVQKWVESLFNITFCYFPIAYRPPANDPYRISTDDLRTALRGCLSALPDFGPLALPVFLDKLQAGASPAKRDTLQTMSVCFPVYGPALARGWARKLWNSLKLEIFQPIDSLTESLALQTVQVLIRTIYADQEASIDNPEEDIQGLARDACEECLNILKEPEKSQARPAMKVLCAFVGEDSTPSVSKYTISQALPHLMKLFALPEEAPTRGAILSLLADLLSAVKLSQSKARTSSSDLWLEEYKDSLLGSLTVGLKVPSARIPALHCLKEIITMTPPMLTQEEVGFVVHNLNELMQEEDDDEYRDDLLYLLSLVAKQNIAGPGHIETQILPPLLASLPERPPSRTASIERAKYWKSLDSLRILCISAPPLFEILIIRLTTKLEFLLSSSLRTPQVEHDDGEPLAAYAHSILKTILKALEDKTANGDPDLAKYVDRLVPRIFSIFLRSALAPSTKEYLPFSDPRLLVVGGDIVGSIVRALPSSRQTVFVAGLFDAFLHDQPSGIIEKETNIPSGFAPFSAEATTQQKNAIILFAASVVPLHREVVLPVPNLSEYASNLLAWGLSQSDKTLLRESAWKILAVLVNKKAEDLEQFLETFQTEVYEVRLKNKMLSVQSRQVGIEIWGWITKALLIRSHPMATNFLEKLFKFLEDVDEAQEIRWDIAGIFGFVASTSSPKKTDEVFTKGNGCVIKVLYSQRFVQSVLPRIMNRARDGKDNGTQVTYLIALTSLITSIPKSVYVSEIANLMPLLLLSLDLPDASIRTNVIETLTSTIQGEIKDSQDGTGKSGNEGEIKKIITEHASSLVNTMLRNASVKNGGDTHVDVRTASLKLLSYLPALIDYSTLHPLKAHIIRQLGQSLDDPKRSVRKEAVNARTKWFQMSG